MKVLLSWLREFVAAPGTAEEIAATMSVRGFAVEGIEAVGGVSGPDGAAADADDAVLDFEVTANRPDCMSILGIAREVATAYGLPVRHPEPGESAGAAPSGGSAAAGPSGGSAAAGPALRTSNSRRAGAAEGGPAMPTTNSGRAGSGAAGPADPADPGNRGPADIDIAIDNPELCARYAGAVADVTVGPSPEWMQARLRAAGVRPISNIVDVTNYVLLELGQPMHAFDRTRLEGGQIRVRTARPGEKLRTLDGQMRELTPEMLVIADAAKAVAIAGVMGGAESEVGDATTTVVFESAYFDPLSVRRTSKKLGLKTEASMRFERGADPHLPVTAMRRAFQLLARTEAGRPRGPIVDRQRKPFGIEPATVLLRRSRIAGFLGTDIADTDVERILSSLGFTLVRIEDGWRVSVPTRRVDIAREVDLIEEVARHVGFDRIPATFPPLAVPPAAPDPRIMRARQLRGVMTGVGFSEAVTFGFIAERQASPFAADGDIVTIANPLSENFAVLRPSALPGLVDAVAHNRRREQHDVRLFEIGARFSRSAGERRAIACAWTGSIGGEHWSGGGRDVDFYDVKGVVERIAEALRVEIRTEPHRESWLVPGRAAAVVANGTRLGVLGQLSPALADAHGLAPGDAVYVAEIDLDAAEALATAGDVQVEPLPRYPSVTRDISILVNETLAAETIRETIRAAAPPTLARVREFDRYKGKGVPEGNVSLSLRLTFRSPDRTLTDAEVQGAMEQVLAALKETHGAVQR